MKNKSQKYTSDELANINFYGNYVDISMQLDELESYLTEFQKYIEVTFRHLQSNRISGYDEDTLENLKYHFEYSHGDLLMKSIIISLATMLEINIREFCNDYQKHLGVKIRLQDLKGDLLNRFKLYSNKVLFLNFDFQSELWLYITGFYEIRNCLVHNSGVIENYGKRNVIENFINKSNLFAISDNRYVTLTYKGCIESLKKIEHFFITITEIAFDRFPGSYRLRDAEKYELPIIRDK